MAKPTLLIFSQCFIYGGSERLMQSVYKSRFITKEYNVIFSYSYFSDYQKGIERDCADQIIDAQFQKLYLATNGPLFNKINLNFENKLLRRILKLPLFCLEFIGLYSIWNYVYLFLYLLKIRPEVLHINNGGYPAAIACNQIARVALLFKDSRVIYQINNKAVMSKGIYSRIIDYWINRSVSVFLTHSKQNRQALIERGFDSSKVVSIPSFFNETILNEYSPTASKINGKFMLCMVGFLSYRKGQMFLLKALLEIKERNPYLFSDLHLNLVGDGEQYHVLMKFINENNLRGTVTLCGNRPDYINYILDADIYLITSIEGEDLPLVLLTAMQYEKCIVASEFAGIAEHLTNDSNSILVQPDVNTISTEIAEAVIKLYGNSALRKSLAENARKTFEENLGEQKYSENLIQLYKSSTRNNGKK